MPQTISTVIPTTSGLAQLLINPGFRWFCYIAVVILTIIGYLQEPVRFSTYTAFTGLPLRYHYYFTICLTLAIYIVTFLGLWYTIRPDGGALSTYWYIPLIILVYAIVTQIMVSSTPVSTNKLDSDSGNENEEEAFHPPPWYMLPRDTRIWIYYAILALDIIIFISALLYAGTSTAFRSTILHRYILNRFGGLEPGNVLNFIIGWIGLGGLLIDAYVIRVQNTFSACQYGLPASWDF